MENAHIPTAVSVESERKHECWSCGDMRAAHFCNSCGRVQPPKPTDYFSFFGLPRKLNIEDPHLEREFHALSRKLHPDIYAGASSREQLWSLEQSSQLNDAYRTLRDPISRTEYLLRQEGIELGEQSKTATEKARVSGAVKRQILPPDLLEEVFELNLQIEQGRENKKHGEADPGLAADLQQTRKRLEERYDALLNELKACWKSWDAMMDGGGTDQERTTLLGEMVDVLNRRTYIRNLVRDIVEVLEG